MRQRLCKVCPSVGIAFLVTVRRRSPVFSTAVGPSGIAPDFERLLGASTGFGGPSLDSGRAVAGSREHRAEPDTGCGDCDAGLATSLQKLSTRDHEILHVARSIDSLHAESCSAYISERHSASH